MFTIDTGAGYWTPLIWCLILVITFLLIYILRGFGRKDYKKDTDQVKSFLSGNIEAPSEQHIKASNLYWGFTTSLKWLFGLLRRMHTGNASDYVLWFIIILALFFIVGMVVI
ncbi:MAG: hydrogenase [Methanobacteriota archaeon]